jgi:hypothetical protein
MRWKEYGGVQRLRGRNWFDDKSKEGTALTKEELRILKQSIIK